MRHGPSQAAASLQADIAFGFLPLHAPSSAADDGCLCVWVGETKFEDDSTATPTISICMILKVNAIVGSATVKTLRGPYGVWRDYIE
jgi:hypothetical protein